MHDIDVNFDLSLEEISKIEGAASLDIKVRNSTIQDLHFIISEWKRFYTQAMQGKPVLAIPQLVARICGTCSNAHLLASIKAIENGFNIIPSQQTMLLRKLLYNGLIIRDHALHLYVFFLPDVFGKPSILDFDEHDPIQHEMLDDAFTVKEVGNQLSILSGGRSVHAPFVTIGGFLKLPSHDSLKMLIPKLQNIRSKILRFMEILENTPFAQIMHAPVTYVSMTSPDFSFLDGTIYTSEGTIISNADLDHHLKAVIIPYSHARGFTFDGKLFISGALSRLNLGKDSLHPNTKQSAASFLSRFPSSNLFDNNLGQAIEILHAIDSSLDIIQNMQAINVEPVSSIVPKETVCVSAIEAPRGLLFYRMEINAQGIVEKGEIIVPTGLNQVLIEKALYELVQKLLTEHAPEERVRDEAEHLIRAFDPCMSCASHFLKVNLK